MIRNLVAISVSLAERAGAAIRKISTQDNLHIINKGDANIGEFDPQTEADRVAQAIIIDNMKKLYPKCVIIGEEGDPIAGNNLSSCYDEFFNKEIKSNDQVLQKCSVLPERYQNIDEEDFVIWLDPLDGTSDFTNGLREHVTVLIGIALKCGEPIAGIVHQPFYNNKRSNKKSGRTIWSIVGIGAFNIEDLSSQKESSYVVATSKTHVDDIVLNTMKSLGATKILHSPGAGFKSIQLMEKFVDAFVYPGKGTSKWDICATDAICRSIVPPIIVTDFFDRPFDYSRGTSIKNNHGIIAASESIHHAILEKIPQQTLDYLKNP